MIHIFHDNVYDLAVRDLFWGTERQGLAIENFLKDHAVQRRPRYVGLAYYRPLLLGVPLNIGVTTG